ncbi:MAG: TIGR03016 family PEP-CTERM system-associated outer membrane protein [Pseudomonadota bacterium]
MREPQSSLGSQYDCGPNDKKSFKRVGCQVNSGSSLLHCRISVIAPRTFMAAGLALAATSFESISAEWVTQPAVSASSYYTDNVCLAPDDEEGKFVGIFTPSIRMSGTGARARMALQAAAQYNTLGDSDIRCNNQGFGGFLRNREAWVPRINFAGSVDAVDNWLVLDATARASQNPINPFAAGGSENLNALGNTNITYQYGAGATISRQYRNNLNYLLRYNYTEQYNSVNVGFGDSQQDLVVFDAGMIPAATRLSFRVAAQYQEVTFEEQGALPEFTNRLARAEVNSIFRVTDDWSLDARIGEEDNVFTSQSDDVDGSYWDAGIRWAPNARVTVGVGYGERFFGNAPRADVSYRHKRSSLTASFLRSVQFPRNLRAGDQRDLPDNVDPVDPGFLPGDDIGSISTPTFIGNQPILNDRFTLRYDFTARRTNFSLALTESQQTVFANDREGTFRNAQASVTRRLSGKTSAFLRYRWQENRQDNTVVDNLQPQGFESSQYTVGVTRRLSPQFRTVLQYRYTDQQGNQEANGFIEQRVILSFNYRFR